MQCGTTSRRERQPFASVIATAVSSYSVTDDAVSAWQNAIVDDGEAILQRSLTRPEAIFIQSRGSFVALETIHDTVRALTGKPADLQQYLRSESDE